MLFLVWRGVPNARPVDSIPHRIRCWKSAAWAGCEIRLQLCETAAALLSRSLAWA
jgi:hypothetical protein